jgi:hypothetical protein
MLVREDCPVRLLFGDALADWTAEFQHSALRLDRDFELPHATGIFMGTQGVPNHALGGADRRFIARASVADLLTVTSPSSS